MLDLFLIHLPLAADMGPDPNDVKAGWTAFAIFIALCLVVAFLGFSLTKQLKKAQRAKDEGVYGDEPVAAPAEDEPVS